MKYNIYSVILQLFDFKSDERKYYLNDSNSFHLTLMNNYYSFASPINSFTLTDSRLMKINHLNSVFVILSRRMNNTHNFFLFLKKINYFSQTAAAS